MVQELYRASAPGSMMLMGEHAVLEGMQGIVCALNQQIHLELIPNGSEVVTINDSRLGRFQKPLHELSVEAPYTFVLGAILLFKDQITTGFSLNINSQFPSNLGLGSSAAVTVGTIGVLIQWLNIAWDKKDVFLNARAVIQKIQGAGSGADAAASTFGGTLAYTLDTWEQLPLLPPFTAVYCGYKTPTPQVIALVAQKKAHHPKKVSAILKDIDQCAIEAIKAIREKNWPLLGTLFTRHHGLQRDLGVSNEQLDKLVGELRLLPSMHGAKISGAGLGDCVIGLGETKKQLTDAPGMLQFLVQPHEFGLTYANN